MRLRIFRNIELLKIWIFLKLRIAVDLTRSKHKWDRSLFVFPVRVK